jgi:DNA replication protein DnaC
MIKSFNYPTSLKEQKCVCGKFYVAKWLLIVDQWRDTSSSMCPECFIAWKKQSELDEQEQLKQQEIQKKAEMVKVKREFYRRITIPIYYQVKTFSEINVNVKGNMRSVLKECVKYAENYPLEYGNYILENRKPYPSLFIASPEKYGVGKTHLVSAITHRILDRWNGGACPVTFITEPDIYLRIQNTYSFNDTERKARQSEADIINEMIKTPLLIIDDIGKQKRSDMKFVQRTLFAIINGRYDAMKPLILTTNMNIGQLGTYLGANDGGEYDRASFDRLIEMCKGNMWELDGESQRGK